MSGSQPNFNLGYLNESSDDETIFITQTPKVSVEEENVNDKSVSDLDLEELLCTSKDSAIDSVASIGGSDKENNSDEEQNLGANILPVVVKFCLGKRCQGQPSANHT